MYEIEPLELQTGPLKERVGQNHRYATAGKDSRDRKERPT
jgi:hypothetical protein